MKRKILYFVALLTIFGLFTMQSCKKDAWLNQQYVAAMPEAPVPANAAVWPLPAPDRLYLCRGLLPQQMQSPGMYISAISGTSSGFGTVSNANTYTATVTKGGTYYWQVITTDANDVESASPDWSFEVNSNPNVPTNPAPAVAATKVS